MNSITRRRALGTLIAGPALLASMDTMTAEPLATRAIPSTGERLPVIGVGTWQTFDVGESARAPLVEVLRVLAAAGARVVDSSPMYGRAEEVAGSIIAAENLREKLFLASKVWTRGRVEGIREMERSAARMRAGRLDLLQIHNLLDVETHTRTLAEWKHAGRVRYVGITHYHESAYSEVERLLRTRRYDFLQINYSLAERSAEKRLLPLAIELGVAVIANRPFAEGSLFAAVKGRSLPPVAAEIGAASWAQFFLKWILGHPAITCTIPGTGRADHMRDNLAAGSGPLPDAALRGRMAVAFDKR